MGQSERRGTERVTLTIPIRVIGVDSDGRQFSEDASTRLVDRGGARIALKHRILPDEVIRIVNLETLSEADFRVVGPTQIEGSDACELGVECIEKEHNIWGVELPPALTGNAEAATLLECRGCKQQASWALTPMEIEVLDSSGQVVRQCANCGKAVYWIYADVAKRPRAFAPSDPVSPPVRPDIEKKTVEKRSEKRINMKMPIMVRTAKGETEISKTENVSRHGFAANLGLELAVGETVSVVCPYEPGGQNIEQKAEVRHRSTFSFGGLRLYGFQYVR